MNETLFNNCGVFNTDEVRSFIFILTPKLTNKTINRYASEKLGQLEIKWFNYFGDAGYLTVGPFKYTADNISKFEIDIVQCKN